MLTYIFFKKMFESCALILAAFHYKNVSIVHLHCHWYHRHCIGLVYMNDRYFWTPQDLQLQLKCKFIYFEAVKKPAWRIARCCPINTAVRIGGVRIDKVKVKIRCSTFSLQHRTIYSKFLISGIVFTYSKKKTFISQRHPSFIGGGENDNFSTSNWRSPTCWLPQLFSRLQLLLHTFPSAYEQCSLLKPCLRPQNNSLFSLLLNLFSFLSNWNSGVANNSKL